MGTKRPWRLESVSVFSQPCPPRPRVHGTYSDQLAASLEYSQIGWMWEGKRRFYIENQETGECVALYLTPRDEAMRHAAEVLRLPETTKAEG